MLLCDADNNMLLIITADDFGYCCNRNRVNFLSRAILRAFEEGVATQASLLVNAVASQHAALLAKDHDMPTALHFNITEGHPLYGCFNENEDKLALPGYVSEDGFFGGKHQLLSTNTTSWHIQDIYHELQVQLQHYHDLIGRPCRHLDAHNHAFMVPQVQDAIALYASQNLRTIRVPRFPTINSSACDRFRDRQVSEFLEHVVTASDTMHQTFSRSGLRTTEAFLGLDYDRDDFCTNDILTDLRTLVSSGIKSCEIMMHPGYPSKPSCAGFGKGPDEFARSNRRLNELNILCDPKLRH
eukprot:gene7550-9829_t